MVDHFSTDENMKKWITFQPVLTKIQNDEGQGKSIFRNDPNHPNYEIEKSKNQKYIANAIAFGQANSETEVWHFLVSETGIKTAVHHFVVIPWYNDIARYTSYTIYMAYEKSDFFLGYSLNDYINKINSSPRGEKGYKLSRTAKEMSEMLYELLYEDDSWELYFGQGGGNKANKIKYWKYRTIPIMTTIFNAEKYPSC